MEGGMAADKDIISKQILKRIALDMAIYLFGLDIREAELLETEFQRVEDRRADLLLQVKAPEQYLLHIEVQNDNAADMPLRMLRYFADIALAYPGQRIRQYLIYIGRPALRMADFLDMPEWRYQYRLVDMHRVDCKTFLAQDNPDALVLAILCDFKEADARLVIRHILSRLQTLLADNTSRLREYVGMLEALSGNRNLQTVVHEEQTMLSTMKLSDLPSYQQGRQDTLLAIIRAMLAKGLTVEAISDTTGLNLAEVQAALLTPEAAPPAKKARKIRAKPAK
jgi:predicted transposase YdaD